MQKQPSKLKTGLFALVPILFGVFIAASGLFSLDDVYEVIKEDFPESLRETNIRAVEKGYEEAKRMLDE